MWLAILIFRFVYCLLSNVVASQVFQMFQKILLLFFNIEKEFKEIKSIKKNNSFFLECLISNDDF